MVVAAIGYESLEKESLLDRGDTENVPPDLSGSTEFFIITLILDGLLPLMPSSFGSATGFVDVGCVVPACGPLDDLQFEFKPQSGYAGTTHPSIYRTSENRL